jgi:hypothetical protein
MAPANPDQGYGPTRNSPIKFVNVNSVGRFLENFCRKHPRSDGKLLRVWATEIGWPTGTGRNAGGESEQAAYIARTLIQHRRTGVLEALFIYDLLSDGNMHSNAEHNFGLLRNDLSPKPAFAAAAAFLRIVGNRKCTGVICDESNFKVFRFEDVLVAYAVEKNKPLTLTGFDSARVFQWDGYENGNTPVDGKLTLKLSKMPVYVKIGGKSNPQIIKDGKNK